MHKTVFALVALCALAAGAGFAQSGTMMAPPAGGGPATMSGASPASGAMSGGTMSSSPSMSGGSTMGVDKAMGGGSMSGDKGAMNAMSASRPVAFTDLDAARRLAAKGPTVLFFAADWDAASRADLADLAANGGRLSGVTVVVADFDKTADVRARYGIAYQGTYVQIDGDGKPVAVWSGGGVDGILTHVARM